MSLLSGSQIHPLRNLFGLLLAWRGDADEVTVLNHYYIFHCFRL